MKTIIRWIIKTSAQYSYKRTKRTKKKQKSQWIKNQSSSSPRIHHAYIKKTPQKYHNKNDRSVSLIKCIVFQLKLTEATNESAPPPPLYGIWVGLVLRWLLTQPFSLHTNFENQSKNVNDGVGWGRGCASSLTGHFGLYLVVKIFQRWRLMAAQNGDWFGVELDWVGKHAYLLVFFCMPISKCQKMRQHINVFNLAHQLIVSWPMNK